MARASTRTSPSQEDRGESHDTPNDPMPSSPQPLPPAIPGLTDATEAELRSAATSPLHRSSLLLRQQTATDETLLHGGSRSLSSIALHAFVLGIFLAASLLLTIYLAILPSQLWRLALFLATLSLFHFLEFYTTARWNTATAKVGSFLVFSNGAAYNIAYAVGMLEIVVTWWFLPGWQLRMSPRWLQLLGAGLMVLGQLVRSTAMATAGTNFNHVPVKRKTQGHVLVTNGIYALLRHPSYFGFFWWAIGTQILVGNAFCSAAYTVVLWGFFRSRIEGEEKFLVQFFGEDYTRYRQRVGTWIPFIR